MDKNNNLLLAILFAVSNPLTLALSLLMAIPAAIWANKICKTQQRFPYIELSEAHDYYKWSLGFRGAGNPKTIAALERYQSLKAELLKAKLLDDSDLEVWT